ncbi:MAG: hypothetical protein P1U83_11475 [Roseovarius sp.]|nr:hypothetical protein [Roseovarius sp.]
MANWIVEGRPSMDLSEVDVQRAMPFESNLRYLSERVSEGGGALFDIFWPFYQPETARNVRRSPLHDRLRDAHAQFDFRSGWEDAGWFANEEIKPIDFRSFSKEPWFDALREEHLSAWNGGGVSDLSNNAKFYVQGAGAAAALQKLCAIDLPETDEQGVFTPVLDDNGFVLFCVDVCRINATCFLILADPAQQTRLASLLQSLCDEHDDCVSTDMTSAFAIMRLFGDDCSDILSHTCGVNGAAFAYRHGDFRSVDLAYGRGWIYSRSAKGLPVHELIVPSEFAVQLYDYVVSTDRKTPLKLIGSRARNAILLEADIHHRERPYHQYQTCAQLGLDEFCRISDVDGVPTNESSKQISIPLRLADSAQLLFGGESIYDGDDIIGSVSEFGFGFKLNAPICLGQFTTAPDEIRELISAGRLTVAIGDAKVPLQHLFADSSELPLVQATS